LRAGLVRVAALAAAYSGHSHKAVLVVGIARIVDQRPGTVERGRTEIIVVPAHGVAGRIADAAIDALDRLVDGDAGGLVRLDGRDRIGAGLRRREHALRLLPLLEEARHI